MGLTGLSLNGLGRGFAGLTGCASLQTEKRASFLSRGLNVFFLLNVLNDFLFFFLNETLWYAESRMTVHSCFEGNVFIFWNVLKAMLT
jgi:hypothetical protein